jgi:hypothetical protein
MKLVTLPTTMRSEWMPLEWMPSTSMPANVRRSARESGEWPERSRWDESQERETFI